MFRDIDVGRFSLKRGTPNATQAPPRSGASRKRASPSASPDFKNYLARLGDRFKAAGIANWMAHRSRHYWATSAHRAGMSVFDIAAEGGWRDLKMVQRSTKNRPFEELHGLPTPLSFLLP